ncbi:MAG TPA: SCO family protein [Rhizomicrobium sp.]
MFRRDSQPIAALLALLLALGGASCGLSSRSQITDITGVMPSLAFRMARANDGERVSADNYRGKVAILYFGYTHCPDECPATLANLAAVLQRLGNAANDVRVLFVSVDPARDTVPVLKSYVEAFAPEIDGLRGSDDAIAALTRRYRVIYAVTPASPGRPYAVMHSDSVFFFDRNGRARFVAMATDQTADVAARIDRLLLGK